MRMAMRVVLLVFGATACGDSVCVTPPCALQPAVVLNVTSTVSGGAISNAFVRTNGAASSEPCSQASGSTCYLMGSPGTYELDIGAPGFQTVHRTLDVHGTTATCGCSTIDTQHLTVALVPAQ